MARPRNLPIPPVGTLCAILWEDAAFSMDTEEHGGTELMETVGWITKLTRTTVTIAGERSPDNTYHRAVTSIPRSLVRLVTPLYDQEGL
jgi:hypothetical protein